MLPMHLLSVLPQDSMPPYQMHPATHSPIETIGEIHAVTLVIPCKVENGGRIGIVGYESIAGSSHSVQECHILIEIGKMVQDGDCTDEIAGSPNFLAIVVSIPAAPLTRLAYPAFWRDAE